MVTRVPWWEVVLSTYVAVGHESEAVNGRGKAIEGCLCLCAREGRGEGKKG